jgi:hypothetical protein
MCAA